jgi:indolepyruvate ferredoxin oxidoreductase beta subunit
MTVESFNCLSVGVGGQGVIRATQILAHAAMLDAYNVRTAETHGMAQRGGSVTGYLRFGENAQGSLIPRGGANVIMSLEPSEALRNRLYANEKTSIFININRIMPLSIYQKRKLKYPEMEEIKADLHKITKNVHFIDANRIALEAGNIKTVNVVMIGFMFGSGQLPLNKDHLYEAVMKYVPKKAKEVNDKSFKMGFEAGKKLQEEKLNG